MILTALTEYYEALVERGVISGQGWSPVKISFSLNLDREGKLTSVSSLCEEQTRGKKTVRVAREMNLPAPVKRSSGVNSNFLWDNSAYILGVDEKGKPERTRECFLACRKKHEEILEGVDDAAAQAIICFFQNWKPEDARENPLLEEYWDEIVSGGNLTFKVDGEFVSSWEVVRRAWEKYNDSNGAQQGICLVTGNRGAVARLHPSIKGIPGAQSSGASLVSFNSDAYCSYGKEQGDNAPVSEYAAFAYASALNYLISDYQHRQTLGDTVIVYWAKDAEPVYKDLFSAFWSGASERMTQEQLSSMMTSLIRGLAIDWDGVHIRPEDEFFILGIAPNAARLSIRFFARNTFGKAVENLQRHYDDIAVVHGRKEKNYLSPWDLVSGTVNQKSKDKKPCPRLAGDLSRAILEGFPYPETLYQGVLLRIRADHEVSYSRAAVIKGYLLRSAQKINKEGLTVELNEESSYAPYVLGRMFSVLEALQEAANPGINATIRDRYFNSACATPALVFPTLLKLAQSHLRKLEPGRRKYYESLLTELMGRITSPYPKRLNLRDQGIFQLGYYHQTQRRFSKKSD